jgi:SAM-dependent methyltransferase
MADYAILLLPSLNRVYSGTAARLTLAELAVYNDTVLGGSLRDLAETTIGGAPYVTFCADGVDTAYLSNLSSIYALYERVGDGLLRPLALTPLDLFSSDLLTILKYPGKTNEQFTKLLLNVTALTTDRPGDLLARRLRVLDPLCGRGTTLNQAMMYGLSAAGVDIDTKDVEAYGAFLKTWLRTSRVKHKAESGPMRRNRAVLGRRLDVELAPSKEQYKSGELIKLTAISGDTLHIGQFFRNGFFDVVVADLPYGVQHGSHGRSLARSPLDLLRAALPSWVDLLAAGGALGLSFNTHVARRADVVELLAGAGLAVRDYEGFEHRVDQAIVRDLVVARKN